VDENNNFCGIEDDGEAQETDTVKRNVSNISTFKRVSKKERIEVTKQVLILEIKLMKFYKLCLLKFGYKAEVLEGSNHGQKSVMCLGHGCGSGGNFAYIP